MSWTLRRNALRVVVMWTATLAFASGCGGAPTRARDVAGDRRPHGRTPDADSSTVESASTVPEAPRPREAVAPKGDRPRVIAKASARAMALDAAHVYYGDSDDDGIYSIAKAGGVPFRIARHAPVFGALALDGGFIMWIASPGDVVLRAPITGGVQPTTLRDRGIFSGVAATSGDVFIAEALAAGGALIRVTGATASRLAAFDGPARDLMADGTHAFIVTSTKVFRTPHERGELQSIASGTRFSRAAIDDSFVYAVAEIDKSRAVVRFPKTGGAMAVLARDVRDAPIAVDGHEVFFFDATRPQVRSVGTSGGESHVLAEDEGLATVSAIEADAEAVYVAQGVHETGLIVAIARR